MVLDSSNPILQLAKSLGILLLPLGAYAFWDFY